MRCDEMARMTSGQGMQAEGVDMSRQHWAITMRVAE